MRPIGSGEKLEARRRRAIILLKKGMAPVNIAKILKVDRRSVRRWKSAYREGGSASLRAKPVPGRPSRFGDKLKLQLDTLLKKGPKANGLPEHQWTYALVSKVIKRRFGISYHAHYIGPFLRSAGWDLKRLKQVGRAKAS